MRKIREIILHCTDSCDSLDIGVREITQWHTDPKPHGNGWADVGYHFIIRRNGTIEIGRPMERVGAHVKGHNKRSVGICWVGRRVPTPDQYRALIELATALMKEYKLTFDDVLGHTELDDGKTCPNLDMARVRGDVLFTDKISEKVWKAIDESLAK